MRVSLRRMSPYCWIVNAPLSTHIGTRGPTLEGGADATSLIVVIHLSLGNVPHEHRGLEDSFWRRAAGILRPGARPSWEQSAYT
jgi:hypothetical protein